MFLNINDREIIEKFCKNNINKFIDKKIVIFGITSYVKCIVDVLYENKVNALYIIDNNTNKVGNGKKCLGIETRLPDNLPKELYENAVFIICSKYQNEMKAQLLEYGVATDQVLCIPINEAKCLFSSSKQEMDEAWKLVCKGRELYESIRDKHGYDMYIFVLPYRGTGDAYMACRYLPQYVRQNAIDKFIIIVNGDNSKRVVRLFGYDAIDLSAEDIEILMKAWELWKDIQMNLKPLLHWGWRTKKFLIPDRYPNITFSDMFLYDTFSFDRPYEGVLPYQKVEGSWTNYFANYGLEKGKTVVLSPYAGSFEFDIGDETWVELTRYLLEKGYSVCTNCVGEEKCIEGTIPLAFSYEEAIGYIEYAGTFIGVRSGLCDIICSASANLIFIYEDGFNSSSYNHFSFNRMGINESCNEIVLNDDIDILEIIKKYI